ncbi:hypothetical protein QJS04_geneDACA019615 [Acorus gramineus]|uniref:Reverse transcriptase zinc-binding domain-containing protein n=1 Tax=Acorus gramineus TaxID=55184 RepID=A0AAV9BLI1_ACOGR|nr:hypothetical protein QJS04_geneDACA019615 [Acorus gramineus]
MDITCPVCEATFETSFHLFCECSFTVDCWRLSPSSMLPPQEVWTTQSWIEVFEDRHWTHTHSNQVKRLFFIAMLWGLWKMRDQDHSPMLRQIVETVHHAALDGNCITFSKVSRHAVRGAEVLARHAMRTSSDGDMLQS